MLLLCQIIIIVGAAIVLAQPAVAENSEVTSDEKIFIIDASASMLAATDGETRFERAVAEVQDRVDAALTDGTRISVILAGKQAEAIVLRIDADSPEAQTLNDELAALANKDNLRCSFGKGDIDGAMTVAESVTAENPDAEVLFFTGTKYLDEGNVTVVDVSEYGEWNVAILDGRASLDDGFYTFYADVASYGRDVEAEVVCTVRGINGGEGSVQYSHTERLSGDRTFTLQFSPSDDSVQRNVYEYESVEFAVRINDSFLYDNNYHLFGGTREKIKIQYYSSAPNPFFSGVLWSLRDAMDENWDIDVDDVRGSNAQPAGEGYDIYVFEHTVPTELPTDGVVILADPNGFPDSMGISAGGIVKTTEDNMYKFTGVGQHPIMEYVTPSNIGVTQYMRIVEWDNTRYTPLMYCQGDPVCLVENNPASKVVVMAFSVHYSTATLFIDFPALIYGIFNYFLPTTTNGYVFDVNSEIALNARGTSLTVSGPDAQTHVFTEFPASLSVEKSGDYIITQTLINGTRATDRIFVRVPVDESNIIREVDVLNGPIARVVPETVFDMKILFWILGAVVAVLFVEWWLHSRSGA